ncbi:hypothetical protein [Aurantibacter aestuarii]|uniref:Uncharacterized protein n=1 Tax=Aurantibacter aestuarii TaxID=1266046 RepID=A0A2T1NEK8_9FLAO|nr:hypothetical protein [Aurantibacter aestuarii]PSG90885.1 hypothetical protein C7H52_06320 [Aurantibacter aestuarii]
MKNLTNRPTTSQRKREVIALASLFGKSSNKKQSLGTGDTYFGINAIKDWIYSNLKEVDSKKAVEFFKSNSLKELVSKIHSTLYNNFTYVADGYDQDLQSPNYAFHNRHVGMDCKSFTILASTFLLVNNVKHYLRKIKQFADRPDEFSHIYIVVPTDQQTANLASGYYVLDATLSSNTEPLFIEKHDIFMKQLPYNGLNGANNNANGLNNSFDFGEMFKDVDWGDLKSIFKSLSCLGGSAYSSARLQQDINLASAIISERIKAINESAFNNDMVSLGKEVQNFFGFVATMNHIFIEKKHSNGWNSCTTKALNSIIDWSHKVRYVGGKALIVWFDRYYDVTFNVNAKRYYSSSIFNALWAGYMSPTDNTQWAGEYTLVRKNPNEEVKAFVYNDYLTSIDSPAQINETSFLNSLSTVLIPLVTSQTNGSNDTSNDGTGNQNTYEPIGNNNNEPKKASTANLFFGGVLLGTAVYYGGKAIANSKKSKNKNQK